MRSTVCSVADAERLDMNSNDALKELKDQLDKDSHFFVSDVANRLPTELLPETKSWSALLAAITQLKTERNNALIEAERLRAVMRETIEGNLHLADGENCTLIKLERAISY